VIEDLGSVNGNFVNRERVTRQAIKIGDTITLVKTSLQFLHLRAPEGSAENIWDSPRWFDENLSKTEQTRKAWPNTCTV